jgi:hypothetical protein
MVLPPVYPKVCNNMSKIDPLERVIIVGLREEKSRHGGDFYYVYFHDREGNRWSTCVYKMMRNYSRWQPYLKIGAVLRGAMPKDPKQKLINADSHVELIHMNLEYVEAIEARKKRKKEIIGTQGTIGFPEDSKPPYV